MGLEKVEAAAVPPEAGSSGAIPCNTLNNSSATGYIRLSPKDREVVEFLKVQPDSTNGEIATACNLDYARTKIILDKLEREGLIRIIMRRHYFNAGRP